QKTVSMKGAGCRRTARSLLDRSYFFSEEKQKKKKAKLGLLITQHSLQATRDDRYSLNDGAEAKEMYLLPIESRALSVSPSCWRICKQNRETSHGIRLFHQFPSKDSTYSNVIL
ncbi:hypothetical protein PFISCL1PPCAC_14468, partial [Pristionchus fissidentatus]